MSDSTTEQITLNSQDEPIEKIASYERASCIEDGNSLTTDETESDEKNPNGIEEATGTEDGADGSDQTPTEKEKSQKADESIDKAAAFIKKNKKPVAIGAIVVVILIILIASLATCSGGSYSSSSSSSKSSSSPSSSSSSSTSMESTLKSYAAKQLYRYISMNIKEAEAGNCKFDISTIKQNGSGYTIQGHGYLYNSYGKFVDKNYSFTFTVEYPSGTTTVTRK